MKNLVRYKKFCIVLAAAFLALSGTYFLIGNFDRLSCPLCKAELDPNEIYLWDVHAGVFAPLSPYLSGQSDVFWLDPDSHLPQEVSVTRGCGIVRFPGEAEDRAGYCRGHAGMVPGNSRFAALARTSAHAASIPITQTKAALLSGHKTLLHYDEALDAWTLTVYW